MKQFYIYIVCVISALGYTQQDPQYTQYMYNLSVVNPAYVGAAEYISLGVLYRNQWTGFEGAPQTSTFFSQFNLNEKGGVGLSIITDEIGPVVETNVYADLAYTLRFKNNNNLSFGLKAGATFHNIGLSDVFVINPTDPFFNQSITNTTPNIGFGVFYFTDTYYAGFSVPNLLNSVHLNINGNNLGSETQHYFVTSGFVFDMSETVRLKPSFLIKSAFDAPVSIDFNTNVLLYDKLEFGVSYRNDDSFSGLVNFAISQNLNIGYAYDAVRSDIRNFAPSSHEISIRYNFERPCKCILSPRFF